MDEELIRRSQAGDSAAFAALPLDGVEPPPALGPSLEDALGEDEALYAALAQLSDKLRAVVVLRYGRDLSYQEIADVLDIPVGTVKSRMDLALKTLRGLLDPANLRAPSPRALSPKVGHL
ncbi:MAG: RNA polymerase sigma factor [Chloroflexi bacterium]|nr:RNA polymerase sigma factor [Chloroflexota bacterium]